MKDIVIVKWKQQNKKLENLTYFSQHKLSLKADKDSGPDIKSWLNYGFFHTEILPLLDVAGVQVH